MKEFEKIEKLPYEKKRPKNEPTDIYFHPAIKLAKCMMIYDNLNWCDHGGYTKMAAPSLNVNPTDEDKSKRIIVHDTLSWNCSTDKSESKHSIVNEKLLQSCSTDEDE